MPSWGQVLEELLQNPQPNGQPDWDGVRRRYLSELYAITGRPTIAYYSGWLAGKGGNESAITPSDMQGLMEVFKDLPGGQLDLILHSPGGSPDATASLVRYMRSRYDDVRVFVPLMAMSAATMWSLAADRIVMGKHSQLGPIDPQLVMPFGMVPAGALVRQFQRAAKECAEDVSRLAAWTPTLQQYFPGLLEMCQDAEDLGKTLVTSWLTEYMLRDQADAAEQASRIADFFADSTVHKSHGRGIAREEAREKGVKIEDLEADSVLQDAVLSVHHAYMHTMSGTAATKVIENHMGSAFILQSQMINLPMPGPPAGMPPAIFPVDPPA